MKEVEYFRHEFQGELEKMTGDLVSFVYDVPYLTACGVFPPLHILNQILIDGGGDAGMSPGASWTPFRLTEDEYNELWDSINNTDPSELSSKARYTFVKYIRDPEIESLTDRFEWMKEACARHRDWFRAEQNKVSDE